VNQSGAPGPQIRRAGPADARAVAEIAVSGWQAAYRGILADGFLDSLSVAARETAWREMLERDADGSTPTWLAEQGGRAVAFLTSGPPRDEDVTPPAAEVYALYVLPAAWRQGVGRALLETAVRHWWDRGADALVLWVLQANAPARSFYQAMGWHPDGGRQQLEIAATTVSEVRYRLAPVRCP
jgi:GNAT superfamily N-acetyltransferase